MPHDASLRDRQRGARRYASATPAAADVISASCGEIMRSMRWRRYRRGLNGDAEITIDIVKYATLFRAHL